MAGDGDERGAVDVMGTTWRTITTPIRILADRRMESTKSTGTERDDEINRDVGNGCTENRSNDSVSQQGSGQGPGPGPGQDKEQKEKRCTESDVVARLLGAFSGDWLSK